jgi:hypothetical protein
MLDEVLEVAVDAVVDRLVPTAVLKLALLAVGAVAAAVGVFLIGDSPLVGGALTVLGAAAAGGVLASWVV